MGRKVNFSEMPKKGPGRKTKKQPPPKFPSKILPRGKFENHTWIINSDYQICRRN